MNEDYIIRRENMLAALGLPAKIPVGQTGSWYDVEVVTGRWVESWGPRPEHHPRKTIVLPWVRLRFRGVANRIRVLCPRCKRTIVRFSCLHQHIGTKSCVVPPTTEVGVFTRVSSPTTRSES